MVFPSPMTLPRFEFEAPSSLQQAATVLHQADGEARLMAGGTDLLVKLKRGIMKPRLVISLGRIPELDAIHASNQHLRLGARATMAQLAKAPDVLSSYSALAEGAGWVGGPIIRNRATVGGNVINARPCADTLPPLIALGAKLELHSTRGTRNVALETFVTGPGQCALEYDEVLAAIFVPAPPANAGSNYIKVTRRAAMEVTIVGCAASVVLDAAKQRIVQARLVFTSVAPVPLRIRSAEQVVEGEAPSRDLMNAAGREAQRAAPVIGDHRAPQDYRAELVDVITRRTLTQAIERAGGESAMSPSKRLLSLTVNGRPVEVAASPHQTLLELLREDLGLTGTKHGCGEGDCGACVVLLDGLPVNACLVLALEAEGHSVETIEGVATDDGLHPLQEAFIEAGSVQCGYCTPGMILVSKSLLAHNPAPTPLDIRTALSGNLCRCTGYHKIVEGVLLAAQRMRDKDATTPAEEVSP